ncbi:hypothetical protein EYB25_005524 [Talaromyces marneffei]|nr:hypothetical protein EYB25_005524 [Talaromyces marneffei]
MADEQPSEMLELPPESYTVGWICAIPCELTAARELLDACHEQLESQAKHDENNYILGRMGKHNVAIACLPEYGTNRAAIAAKSMQSTFPNLRFGVLVGVGGGVPSAQNDIRLGDIAVSLPSGQDGGVIQYDLGRREVDGFHRRGTLNKPPTLLRTAITNLRAIRKLPQEISNLVNEVFGGDEDSEEEWTYPSNSKDILFKPAHKHVNKNPDCDACVRDPTGIVTWDPRRGTNPRIHYGNIGSGNAVIKDALERDFLAGRDSILCFEMEAAGLMDDFPCVVIRGICDYADSHKNKKWQPYAAAIAAAYAKKLLSVISPQAVDNLSPIGTQIVSELKGMNERLEKAFNQQESHHREQITRAMTEDQRRCLQAFKTSTYEQYKNINPNRVEGTCEWVLKSSEYLRWRENGGHDLLWISADPGCGKSVLAKSLIDEVFQASMPTVSICYFFFKDNEEQNSLATALCALLHQLFSLQPDLLRHALPSWERNLEKIQQEVEDLWRIFIAATSDPASVNTICVFDALDECRRSDQKQLIGKLQQYYTKHQPSPSRNWLKFLVTSRPYDEIEEDFQPVIELFPQIHLRGEEENDQIRDEITHVVKIRVSELGKQLKLTAEVKARLEKALLEMEHRTYLWLYLAIDDIRTMYKESLRPDQESVPLIPKSVNEAYGRILDRVTERQEAMVKTILHIIVGARRPLTVIEMAMALGVAITARARRAEEAGLDPEGLSETIRRLCGLFVFIKDSRIYLIHQTAREFLINQVPGSPSYKWYLQPSDTEIQLTQICVKYLLMDDLVSNRREAKQSFLGYCAQNWPDHFRLISSPTPELVTSVIQLYDHTTKPMDLWFPIFWETAMPYRKRPQMNALHASAFNGHDVVISKLSTDGKSVINERDSTGANALQWASLRGHFKSVQRLLEKGAEVNAQGGRYGNALQAASFEGHIEIVQILLERGAEVNAQGGEYGNALQAASLEGHVEIVQRLPEKGAEVNAQGGRYGNALQAASSGGHIEIVQKLLEKGAEVNAQGGDYGNALLVASSGGHVEVVQRLLERGAEVNAQGGFYGNALQAASSGGHIEIVQRLLEKGAEVNAQGGDYGNALLAASSGGHVDVVQVLQKYVSTN